MEGGATGDRGFEVELKLRGPLKHQRWKDGLAMGLKTEVVVVELARPGGTETSLTEGQQGWSIWGQLQTLIAVWIRIQDCP
jgi:hypothetical protein